MASRPRRTPRVPRGAAAALVRLQVAQAAPDQSHGEPSLPGVRVAAPSAAAGQLHSLARSLKRGRAFVLYTAKSLDGARYVVHTALRLG